MSTDNFMAIGDTVPMVDPLWGESIDKCTCSDRVAAATADRVLTNSGRDTSAPELVIYDQLWHDRVAPRVKNRLFMTEMLYRAPSERYNKPFEDLYCLLDEQLDATNGGSPFAMFRMPKFGDFSVLVSTAKNWFSN